jgi:hypothetical protein
MQFTIEVTSGDAIASALSALAEVKGVAQVRRK